MIKVISIPPGLSVPEDHGNLNMKIKALSGNRANNLLELLIYAGQSPRFQLMI